MDEHHIERIVVDLNVRLVGGDEHGISHSLAKLFNLGESILSAISEFATKQNAFNDTIDAAIAGLTEDVQNLNDQIASLQASAGTITPADQALLDGITARAQTVSDKLSALDALTPPKVPTA